MNAYYISRPPSKPATDDQYTDAVVIAKTKRDACFVHPAFLGGRDNFRWRRDIYAQREWLTDWIAPALVVVTALVGWRGAERGVLVARNATEEEER